MKKTIENSSLTKLLIVDDDRDVGEESTPKLNDEGYDVLVATNSLEAQTLMEEHRDVGVALIDIRLDNDPQAGFDLIEEISQKHTSIRIIAYTSYGRESYWKRALQAGAVFYLDRKDISDLVLIVNAVAKMWIIEEELKSLRLKSKWSRNLFDSLPAEILIRNQERAIIQVNKAKKRAWKQRHQLDDSGVETEIENCKGKKTCLDFDQYHNPSIYRSQLGIFTEWRTKDGHWMEIAAQEIRNEAGKHIGYAEIARDVTQRKKVLQRARDLEAETLYGKDRLNFDQCCDAVCQALHEITEQRGQVRIYRVQDNIVCGVAQRGMTGSHAKKFIGMELSRDDKGVSDSFKDYTVKVFPKKNSESAPWDEECNEPLQIKNTTEKVYLPIFDPHNNEPFFTITLNNEFLPDKGTSSEERDLLDLFRRSIETVLWTAIQHEEDEVRNRVNDMVIEIDKVLLEGAGGDKIMLYTAICGKMVEALGARSGTFYQPLPDGRIKDIARAGGVPEREENPYRPHPDSAKTEVIKSGESKIIKDAPNDPGCRRLLSEATPNAKKFLKEIKAKFLIPFFIQEEVAVVGAFHFDQLFEELPIETEKALRDIQQRVSSVLFQISLHERIRRAAVARTEDAVIGRMTLGFAHSVNNAIQRGLKGTLDARKLASSPEMSECLRSTEDELTTVAYRIRDIRQFLKAGRDEAHLELKTFTRQVRRLAEPKAHEEKITLEFSAPSENIYVNSSEGQVRMVMVDLIDNAIKFTPTGGVITLALKESDDNVILKLEDTGIGLTEELIKTINEANLHSANAPSLGVGLYLASTMVAELGGSFKAGRRKDGQRGASFTITLPRIQPNQNHDETF